MAQLKAAAPTLCRLTQRKPVPTVSCFKSNRYVSLVWPLNGAQPLHVKHSWQYGVSDVRKRSITARAGPTAIPAIASTCAAPLISEGWPLWALLTACAAVAQVADARTKLGAALSAPLVSMLCGLALTAAGVIPPDCATYDVVWMYLMPAAAACYLLETDFSALAHTGGTILVAFLIGAAGMVAGATLGYKVLNSWMGSEGGKLAACLCASYVGGSVNFAAVAKAVSLQGAVMPAAYAADNLAMAAFLAVLISIRTDNPVDAPASSGSSVASTSNNAGATSSQPQMAEAADASDYAEAPAQSLGASGVTAMSISLLMAGAAVACAGGRWLAAALQLQSLTLMFTALIAAGASMLGNRLLRSAPSDPSPFAGSAQMGGALMALFFSIIGASAGSFSSLARPEAPAMLAFLAIMVSVHGVVMVASTRLLKLPLPVSILASNACIGGPATCAAMAASKKWNNLVQPGMLVGSLGYAVGTAAGLIVARLSGVPIH